LMTTGEFHDVYGADATSSAVLYPLG
jgi:hypothetical protein